MTEEQAKQRFMLLNIIRLTGLIFVIIGIANLGGKLLPDLAPWFGAVMMVVGATDFFIAPMMLKKQWQNADK